MKRKTKGLRTCIFIFPAQIYAGLFTDDLKKATCETLKNDYIFEKNL